MARFLIDKLAKLQQIFREPLRSRYRDFFLKIFPLHFLLQLFGRLHVIRRAGYGGYRGGAHQRHRREEIKSLTDGTFRFRIRRILRIFFSFFFFFENRRR